MEMGEKKRIRQRVFFFTYLRKIDTNWSNWRNYFEWSGKLERWLTAYRDRREREAVGLAHVHEAGTRRRERSRNAGRRLGVCAVDEEGGGSRPR